MIDLNDRYKEYRKEVQEYMQIMCQTLTERYGQVDAQYLLNLDILAMNLDILFDARDEMKQNGFQHDDHQGVKRKSGAVQQFNTSQNAIMRLTHDFGLTPYAASKIKDNASTIDAKQLLDELVNG